MELDDKLVDTATKYAVTINEFGDIDYGASSSSPCLYREISLLRQSANREAEAISGILWFGASETVSLGDIYYHPDEGYLKIEQITRAKTLVTDNVLKFIKCLVSKQRQVS